jgi:protein kinase C substrate 80K-H
MMKSICFVSAILFSSLNVFVAAQTNIVGIKPSDAGKYAPKEGNTFQCLDLSKSIPYERVNDDFCDCKDGSDEPGTSSCENGKFWCKNQGYIGKYVFSSLVNDNVCDCCDGSDEFLSKKCPNTCEVDGANWRQTMADSIFKVEEGVRIRSEYIAEAHKMEVERNNKMSQLEGELMLAKSDMENIVNELAPLEAEEAKVREKLQKEAEIAAAAATPIVSPAPGETESAVAVSTDGGVVVTPPAVVPEGKQIPAHIMAQAASLGISGFSRKQLLELLFAHAVSTQTGHQLSNLIRDRSNKVVPLPSSAGVPGTHTPYWNDAYSPNLDMTPAAQSTGDATQQPSGVDGTTTGAAAATPAPVTYSSPEADLVRAKKVSSQTNIDRIQRELQQVKDEIAKDFGPNGSFAPLNGKCFDLRVNQYVYTACPFSNARQDSTPLGTYNGWSTMGEGGNVSYKKMAFTGGSQCWNGPSRSMTIHFECGEKDALISVDEPEKCTYAGRFTTPAVCTSEMVDELRQQLIDATGEATLPASTVAKQML